MLNQIRNIKMPAKSNSPVLNRMARKQSPAKATSQATVTNAERDSADMTILGAVATAIEALGSKREQQIAQMQAYRMLQPFNVAEFKGIGTYGNPIKRADIAAAD